MRKDSASSSTSDVSSITGGLASQRTGRSFFKDHRREPQGSSSNLTPSWPSGHMTYPGRRAGSNESDRTSDVSQHSLSSAQNTYPPPKTTVLPENNVVSPIIVHHVASPLEKLKMGHGPRTGSSVTSSFGKPRTMSESGASGMMNQQKLWDKRVSKERASLDSTSSEPARHLVPQINEDAAEEADVAVAHAPTRAKPFIGRANTVQLPMAAPDIPKGKSSSRSSKHMEKPKILQRNSSTDTPKLEEQKMLKDIDDTIQDMTKALTGIKVPTNLSETKAKSFDTHITPIAVHPAKDSLKVAPAEGSTREERILKYKQARRKELAKIANQGKSKSMELSETGKEKLLSEMEPHTPKFSRKYGSRESLDDKPVTTFTSIAVPTQQIVMPSPILPKSVTSPPVATVSPIMATVLSSSESSGVGIPSQTSSALTNVVPSHPESRIATSVAETSFSSVPTSTSEVSFSAFRPVKASSPTKIIPTSAPLDQLSQSPSNQVKDKSPVSPSVITSVTTTYPAKTNTTTAQAALAKDLNKETKTKDPGTADITASGPAAKTTGGATMVTTTESSSASFPVTTASDSIVMSVLPVKPPTSTLLLSEPVAKVTTTLTTSLTTSITTTTASVTAPLSSIRSASSSDLSSKTAKRHVLKKQQCIEESDGLSALKQFVMTPAAIARAERKLAKSKSETSMFRDLDPKQSANAQAEKTFLEKSRRTSKDIEKWEDLIMNVADMQQELENIELKMKQRQKHKQQQQQQSEKVVPVSSDKVYSKQKTKQSDKASLKRSENKPNEIAKQKHERTSPEKRSDNNNISLVGSLEQLVRQKQEASELARAGRKLLLEREDSFNRPDSPIREPMPLPKESVIKRNRMRECGGSSSSSDGGGGGVSPQRSPRVSPRVYRRRKPHSSSSPGSGLQAAAPGAASHMFSVDRAAHAHAHAHSHHKEHGGRRDPNR